MNEIECESCRVAVAVVEVSFDGATFDVCERCVPRGRSVGVRAITKAGRR